MTTPPRVESSVEIAFQVAPPPSHLDHQVMLLDVASRLREMSGPDRALIDARDVDALYELLAPAYRRAGLVLTEGVVHDALEALGKPSFLDLPTVAPWRMRLATLILTRHQWWPKHRLTIGLATGAILAVSVITPIINSVRYDRWVSKVQATAHSAQDMRQQLSLVETEAGSLGGDVAGARVHAGAARQAVGAATSELSHVHAWSDEPQALRQAYAVASAAGPAEQLVNEDSSTLEKAATELQRARSEIALAQSVIASSQTWQNLNVPASLPAALTEVWEHDAALMRSALASGDVNAIGRADSLLKVAAQSGQDYGTATGLIAQLPPAAQPQASQLLEHFNDLVAAGNTAGIRGILDQLRVMHAQVPLAYSLDVVSGPGKQSGVVRELGGAAGSAMHYLIVQARDATGHPVDVPVIDSESHQVVTQSTFGVAVSPEVYAQFKARKRGGESLGPIGGKSAGDVSPAFNVSVLPSTITQW